MDPRAHENFILFCFKKIAFVLVFLFGQGKAGLSVVNVDREPVGPLL